MQLKNKVVTQALFAASCALIAGSAQSDEWDVDAALMYYGEADRVQALEGIFNVKKDVSNEATLSGKLVVDSLTGASANGAVPQAQPQTFTRPSGNGMYTVAPNETPLDDTFRDTRVQASGQWSQPVGENYLFSTGANLSNEYDYRSIGVNSVLARYYNNKNTTASLGLSYAFDVIEPVGGQPEGLSAMVLSDNFGNRPAFSEAFGDTRRNDGEDSKDTIDVIAGVTQVVNRRWVTQFNLSLSQINGYLTDPYKVVSQVDTTGTATAQLYENRPDSRAKQALFLQSKYHFDAGVWDVSYRLAQDDWGIQSHTIESRYRYFLSNGRYLEPHVRFYQQSEADFYTPFLEQGASLPEFASSDYRIGKLDAYTLGMRYGKKFASGREYGVRLEYYSQASQDVGTEQPGQLSALDLYPELDAVIVQFDYRF